MMIVTQRYEYQIALRVARATSLWTFPHRRDTATMRQSRPTRKRPSPHSTHHRTLSHPHSLCEAVPSSSTHQQRIEMTNAFFVRPIIYYFQCARLADVRAKTRLSLFFESVLLGTDDTHLMPGASPGPTSTRHNGVSTDGLRESLAFTPAAARDARDARAASNDEYEHGALPTPPPASSIHEESGARNDALPGSSAQRPAAAHDAQAHASMCQSIECRGHIGRLPFGLSVNWRLDAAFAAFLIIALLLIVVVFGLVAFVRRIPISCGCANNRRRYVDYCDVGAHCAANLNGLSSTAMRFRRIVSSRRIALLLLAVVFRCFRTLLSLLSVFISYTRL